MRSSKLKFRWLLGAVLGFISGAAYAVLPFVFAPATDLLIFSPGFVIAEVLHLNGHRTGCGSWGIAIGPIIFGTVASTTLFGLAIGIWRDLVHCK